MNKINGYIFLFFVFFSFLVGSTFDADNLLGRESSNIFSIFVKLVNPPAFALILMNSVIISFALTRISNNFKFLALLLIINPFLILNVLDAYNRVAFTILTFMVSHVLIDRYGTKFGYISALASCSLHPFNTMATARNEMINVRFVLSSLILLSVFALIYDVGYIFESNDKYELFIKHGAELASMYEGDMVLKKHFTGTDLTSFIIRCVAMIFPYGLVEKSGIGLLILSVYLFILNATIFLYIRKWDKLILILTFMLIAFIVGNVAVFYRHIIPVFIYLVWKQNRQIIIQYNNMVI